MNWVKMRLTSLFTKAEVRSQGGGGLSAIKVDRKISGKSAFPTAAAPDKVGLYPARVHSGAGHFYDDVLEYRVWLTAPDETEASGKEGALGFAAFAEHERAWEFFEMTLGAEPPLALVRQRQYVDEPHEGVFVAVTRERLTEWQVDWLEGAKREPGTIEQFLMENGGGVRGDADNRPV